MTASCAHAMQVLCMKMACSWLAQVDYPSYPVLAPSQAQQPHAHAQLQAQPWGGQAGGMPTGRDFYGDASYGRAAAPGYGPGEGRRSGEGAYGGGGGGGPYAFDPYGDGGGGAAGGVGGASYLGEAPYGGSMQGGGAYGYNGVPAGDYGGTAGPASAYGRANGRHVQDDARLPAEQAYGGAAGLATDFGGLQVSSGGAGGAYAQPAPAAAQPHEHSGYYGTGDGITGQNPHPYSQLAQTLAALPQAAAPAAPAAWQQYMAPDGRPYFHCQATGASQWERPASMA